MTKCKFLQPDNLAGMTCKLTGNSVTSDCGNPSGADALEMYGECIPMQALRYLRGDRASFANLRAGERDAVMAAAKTIMERGDEWRGVEIISAEVLARRAAEQAAAIIPELETHLDAARARVVMLESALIMARKQVAPEVTVLVRDEPDSSASRSEQINALNDAGMTTRAIAEKVGVCARTVKRYLGATNEKPDRRRAGGDRWTPEQRAAHAERMKNGGAKTMAPKKRTRRPVSEAEAKYIKVLYAGGISQRAICEKLGRSKSCVERQLKGRTRPSAWTPERKAAQAERMRAANAARKKVAA